MEAIVIDKKKFEREFKITLDKLKLETLDATKDLQYDLEEKTPLLALQRKFHYEISLLEHRLREG